jgi:hypothetical protein
MPGGQPKKKSRNMVGLRNQWQTLPPISECPVTDADQSDTDQYDSEVEKLAVEFDGLKINYQHWHAYKEEIKEETDLNIDEEIELEMLDDVDFGQWLAEMVDREDEKDADWVPRVLHREQKCE